MIVMFKKRFEPLTLKFLPLTGYARIEQNTMIRTETLRRKFLDLVGMFIRTVVKELLKYSIKFSIRNFLKTQTPQCNRSIVLYRIDRE